MSYDIIPTPKFEEDVKFYRRKRKYFHIDDDIDNVVIELEKGNLLGDSLTDIKLPNEEDVYKVRIVNTDTQSGKSNGYRLIYYAIKNEKTIYLLTIYYKKDDRRVISKEQISEIIEKYCM